ncbi:MAG: teichoic acid biosynthesis protein [Polyangiaceae bacterium]|nr:teichoic acid biosynthesis protein [Polyangiaceae bacterium]
MRILYGVVGEGMGHATRSKVVLEHLVARGHQPKIVVSGRAHGFLSRHFPDCVEIKGLTIHYRDGAMDRDLSVLKNVVLSPSMLLENARSYFSEVDAFAPEVVISDFESYSWLYGKHHGVPVISIDNQQIIHKCDHDDDVVAGVRADFEATRAFIKAKLPGCHHYFATTFFFPEVRAKYAAVTTLVPPILRRAVLEAPRAAGDHVLVYQTSLSDDTLVPTLQRLRDHRFVVYGLRRDAELGNVTLRDFSEDGFIRDLASARAVIANGGQSLINEAVYLGKPILSVPVRHQFEQEMNARYVEKLGYGIGAPRFDGDVVEAFLRERDKFAGNVARHHQDGNSLLFGALDAMLAELGARR